MSKVEKNKVVTFEYTLKNDGGEVLDSSQGTAPLSYIHGSAQIIPGLESEMADKSVGDKFSVSVEPEQAYGVKYDELVKKIDRAQLGHIENLETGMQLQASDGQMNQILTVTEVTDQEVTLDANHPLAGERLHFDVEITEVREANADELASLQGDSCECGSCSCSGDDGCGDSEGSCCS